MVKHLPQTHEDYKSQFPIPVSQRIIVWGDGEFHYFFFYLILIYFGEKLPHARFPNPKTSPLKLSNKSRKASFQITLFVKKFNTITSLIILIFRKCRRSSYYSTLELATDPNSSPYFFFTSPNKQKKIMLLNTN